MMNKVLIVFSLIFSFFNCFAQKEDAFHVRDISLKIQRGRHIPNNTIIIDLSYLKKKVEVKIKSIPKYDERKWDYSKIDTIFKMDEKRFSKIKTSLKKINPNDFLKSQQYIYKDGYTLTLLYGGFGSKISYRFRTPSNRTEERGLIDYFNTCILILKEVGFEKDKIREFLSLKELPQGLK